MPYRVVEQWTAADGLPAETVAGLAIDRDAQLWLATYDGVVPCAIRALISSTSTATATLPCPATA